MLSRTDAGEAGEVTIRFDGAEVRARAGESAAAALIAAGVVATRRTAVSGAARGAYCMMGACFECLAVVNGRPSVQLCLTPVREGMRIETQRGAAELWEEAD